MAKTSDINTSLGELEQELSKIKSASELISEAKETTMKTINETKRITSDLIKNSKKATDSAIKESKKLNEAASLLFKAVDKLMVKLDKVDFPTRLDKLDATVSGINSAIQNVLSRFDSVERNLKDDFDDKIKLVQKELVESQQINLFLLIGILVALIGSFFWLFYNMDFLPFNF
jgi:ABC-type transporter Mla subunit MlaD